MDRHLARAARVYSDRRTRLVTALHRQAPELTVTGVEAGLHLCVLLPGVDDELVVNNLDRLGWRTRSLSSQCSEQSVSGLILNYARLGAWDAGEFAGALAEVLGGTVLPRLARGNSDFVAHADHAPAAGPVVDGSAHTGKQ
jgi:GntR family transcriptional regulator/MocR family aminotransferase